MMSLDEIKKRKEEQGLTNEQLAALSGVPLGTVQKVMGNVTKSPRYDTLQALSKVFQKEEMFEAGCVRETPAGYRASGMLSGIADAENFRQYDRQGTYTVEDYLALPDEQRVELIDGVFYDMGAPTTPHQMIAGGIYSRLSNYIEGKNGPCAVFIAPTDVQLDCDNRTMVQPDVLIVCSHDRLTNKRIFGSPDFVAEVLSPSTKNKDLLIKSAKYQRAGVRELWLVDPMQKNILVFLFGTATTTHMYTFEDKIPVHIYDGECGIDFKEITGRLNMFFGDEW